MEHDEERIAELIARAQTGDKEARDQMLLMYRDRLKRMVAVRMDDRLSARLDPSDVVQEALIEATRKLPEYLRQRPIPFYPWLRRIAWERLVHLHLRHVEAQKRSVKQEARYRGELSNQSVLELGKRLLGAGGSPSAHLALKERQQQVRDALAQLASSDRELLVLRYLEQLPNQEIAVILGISPSAVKTRHFRAVRRLQALLPRED